MWPFKSKEIDSKKEMHIELTRVRQAVHFMHKNENVGLDVLLPELGKILELPANEETKRLCRELLIASEDACARKLMEKRLVTQSTS